MPSAGPRTATIRAKLVVNVVLGVGFMLISVPVITRLPLHEWLSFAWVLLLFLHIVFAWEWVLNVSRRAFQSTRGFLSMRPQVQANYLWDLTLYVTTAIAMVSGVLVSMFALPAMGIPRKHDRFWAILHVSSSEALMMMVGVHLALHWPWIKSTVVKLFTGSLGSTPQRAKSRSWWLRPMAVVTVISALASLASAGLGLTPIATMMRVAPPSRARPPALARAGGASSAIPAPGATHVASPSAGVPSNVVTTAKGGAPAAGQPAPLAAESKVVPARPRQRRPPMSLPRRVLRASGVLGRWMGIPFVVAMLVLTGLSRNRRSAKGARDTRAAESAA